MTTRLFLSLSILIFACNSITSKTEQSATDSIEQNDSSSSTKAVSERKDNTQSLQHHLQDTVTINEDFVLFLQPDSIRFENYANEDENIYDADSDFGFGMSATIDTISKNKKYNNIHTGVSDKRYIVIRDCKNCPQTIDRDTINYGVLLTAKGKEIKLQTNLHSGNYLQDVDAYFNINQQKTIDRKN